MRSWPTPAPTWQSQRITSGFGFLANTAGFDVSQSLIPYSGSDSYTRVFLVGLLNTLLVAIIGIFFATVIGFLVALGRLSPNWLLSRICGAYVELVRNLPLLFQILFWYLAVLGALPGPRQSISLFASIFLSNRGLVVPKPISTAGFAPFAIALLIAIVGSWLLRIYARRQLFLAGKLLTIWPYVVGLLIGLPLLAWSVFGAPVTFEIPELKGFNFSGGSRVIPEFVALTLALSIYTGAFIAEIVRAGIQSVHKGQMEAGSSLGLARGLTLRLIVVPQALRVILPPLTNQYLNLTKNSSLAVAIGISRSGLGIRGHDAQPDRPGDRNHRHHHGRLSVDLAGHQRDDEFLRLADQPEPRLMSDFAAVSFVRRELVPERAAPIKTTGFVGFLRTRLFNSPTNILLTLASLLLLWFTVVPAIRFLLVDAVWRGADRNACLENAGHAVGACWPYVQAKFIQFIYGFYPQAERWRVNLTFILAALLLLPLLIPRLPAKGVNAGLFFVAFPVVAFFLLRGGGLAGFGISWSASLLSGLTDSISEAGRKLASAGEATEAVGPILVWLGKFVVLLSTAVSFLLWPLTWLRDQIQASSHPVWTDFAATAIIVSALVFDFNGGIRTGWRSLDRQPCGLCRHRRGDRGARPRSRRTAGSRYAAVGRPVGDAGGVGHRHRHVDAGRYRIGVGPALDDSADPDFLGRVHRILARRSLDHGAVLRDLHAAAVPARQFHGRWPGSGLDRHRAVCRRL